MILKKFLSVFVSAMFTILIIAGLITVILINVKQQKADSFIADNGSSNSNNTDNENPDWLDRYIETKQQPFNILLFVTDIKGYDTDTIILFNIDSKAKSNSKQQSQAIMDIMLRSFNESVGLCSTTPWVADMERILIKEEHYESFSESFKKFSKKDWVDGRNHALLNRDNILNH